MKNILNRLLKKYDRFLLFIISSIGFSTQAPNMNAIVPQYGIFYGGGNSDLTHEVINGRVLSSKDATPLNNVAVKLIYNSITIDSVTSDNSGIYFIN